jgi:hypothetical protein
VRGNGSVTATEADHITNCNSGLSGDGVPITLARAVPGRGERETEVGITGTARGRLSLLVRTVRFQRLLF